MFLVHFKSIYKFLKNNNFSSSYADALDKPILKECDKNRQHYGQLTTLASIASCKFLALYCAA